MDRYKLKDFAKWAKKEGISDDELAAVVSEMNRGLLGDRLGAHIYKKRIKVDGRGKRGGARAIVLYKDKDVTLFLYGYLKNDQADISHNEEKQLRLFASEFMRLSSAERARLKARGKLIAIES
ncbi:MAG: hypothetical protein RIS36_1788 [Pseudomonadota bacterium]